MARPRSIAYSSLMVVVLFSIESSTFKMKEAYSWKTVDFRYPNETMRQKQLDSGAFIPENHLPLGLEVYKNRVFVTFPRLRPGVAATLTYIDMEDTSREKSPALIPYPDWDTHQLDKENGTKIVSVWRLNVDVCDRLWMVDTGTHILPGKSLQVLPPRILVYDLKTDKLIHEYNLKKNDLKDDSLLINTIVDVTSETCDKAFAYIADVTGYGLIVFDLENNDSWRISHNFFILNPLAGNYYAAGVNFQLADGIFGLALSALKTDGYRTLYFHPLGSYSEFAVSTQVLRNKNGSYSYYAYKWLGSRGPNTQSTSSSLDEMTGVLFYTQIQKDGIGCWNSVRHANEYSVFTNTLITSDKEALVFSSDLKVDKNGNIWVLSDRFPQFAYTALNYSDTNFRILTAPVIEAIKGTVCDTPYIAWNNKYNHREIAG